MANPGLEFRASKRSRMTFMRWRVAAITIVFCTRLAFPQAGQSPDASAQHPSQDRAKNSSSSASQLPASETPPRSDAPGDPAEVMPTLPSAAPGDDRTFSTSRENVIDLSPPKDDLKEHPDSAAATARATEEENAENADVQEFHQWNPMKALKDVEVGDYYFKRKNYRAAMDRYKEALFYKENDAVATFRLAVSQEKLGDKAGALTNYAAYLKILPHGPFADEARASIERLGGEVPSKQVPATKETAAQQPAPARP
jgi:tetratricopeptide (TPR) repeat protein